MLEYWSIGAWRTFKNIPFHPQFFSYIPKKKKRNRTEQIDHLIAPHRYLLNYFIIYSETCKEVKFWNSSPCKLHILYIPPKQKRKHVLLLILHIVLLEPHVLFLSHKLNNIINQKNGWYLESKNALSIAIIMISTCNNTEKAKPLFLASRIINRYTII